MLYIEDLNKLSKEILLKGTKPKIVFLPELKEYEDRVNSVILKSISYKKTFRENEKILIK